MYLRQLTRPLRMPVPRSRIGTRIIEFALLASVIILLALASITFVSP